MKRLLIGSAAIAAMSFNGIAFAADMAVKAPPSAPPPVVNTWTGCYVGADAGGNWGHDDGFKTTATSFVPNPGIGGLPVGQGSQGIDLNGIIGGGYVGCNYQAGVWVLGIEGDWSWTNKEGSATTNTINSTGLFNPRDNWELQERWLATVRGRLGYTWDSWLLYVTGGAAWAKLDSSLTVPTSTPIIGFQSDTRSGWTIGGGLEHLLGYGWAVRAEFLYVQFPSWLTFTHASGSAPTFPFGWVTNQNVAALHDYVFRLGLSYKFY